MASQAEVSSEPVFADIAGESVKVRRVYGRKNIAPLLLKDLVVLTQVRDVANPESDQLKDSIRYGDLINQIDVARLKREDFEAYVAFINRIWNAETESKDFPVSADGYTYLVIAGHSRVRSTREAEADIDNERAKVGLEPEDGEIVLDCKIHDAPSPEAIIALQLNENIYRQPPKERTAMAMVETYLYGLEMGKWANKAEFLRNEEHKFSRSTLNDALHFCELPQHIRDFVFAGGIPYRAGVELGKTLPVYRTYVELKYFERQEKLDLEAESVEDINYGMLEWLGAEVAHVQRARQQGRFSGAIIEGRYKSLRDEYEKYIRRRTGGDDIDQLEFAMADPLADWRIVRERKRHEYSALIRELAGDRLRVSANLINLHVDLFGRTGPEDKTISGIAESLQRDFVRTVGSLAAKSSVPLEV